jgi:hypothetical protein
VYWAAAAVACIYLVWGFASRKEKIYRREKNFTKKEKIFLPFYRMAFWLYKKALIGKMPVFQSRQIQKCLGELYPGEEVSRLQTEFYVKKIGLLLLIFLAGTGIATAEKIRADRTKQLSDAGVLNRNEYQDGEYSVNMEARIGDLFQKELEIEVPVRQYTQEETKERQEEFWVQLCRSFLGKNLASDQVTQDLVLAEESRDFPFLVKWTSSRPDIIGRSGEVTEVEEAVEVTLTAVVTYEGQEWIHKLTVTVVPVLRTKAEQISKGLESLLTETETASRTQVFWNLPLWWQGQPIIWSEKQENNSMFLWGLAVLAAGCVYFFSDKDLSNRLEERRKKMKEAYPFIVHKMVLYLGAGMTIRGAYQKIAAPYQTEQEQNQEKEQNKAEKRQNQERAQSRAERKQNKAERKQDKARKKQNEIRNPAYDNMLYTCHELQTGIPEGEAYEHFGKRSGLTEYVKFSTLLTQNMKKGNSTLLQRLQEEAEESMRERIHQRKQAGEEAATKLLIPMVIMLAVVMILIVVPAFSSVGI